MGNKFAFGDLFVMTIYSLTLDTVASSMKRLLNSY